MTLKFNKMTNWWNTKIIKIKVYKLNVDDMNWKSNEMINSL